MIDEMNNNAAMSARDSYSYDENSDLDELSDLYSDFYSESQAQMEEEAAVAQQNEADKLNSDIEALQAELEAFKNGEVPKKDLMTKDEFLDKQKELEAAQEKKRRQKFRMVGSKEKVTANALEDGIFVAGKKFYKWGDVRVLDF